MILPSPSSSDQAAATALDHPFGQVLAVLGGLVAIGVGIALLVQSIRLGSSDKQELRELPDQQAKFGRLGAGVAQPRQVMLDQRMGRDAEG